ncbi:MAG TPA: biotin/lipoyl-containing protein, partial [Pirellulales bacterium]|nr:biotin/lipoyl-containing protein [Pirellulales bacterium]
IEAVLETDTLCEAAICYTGDVLDPRKTKYDLRYYVEMAKDLERMGAHILAIKDMAGLCKPYAAQVLVKALKQEIGIPIHFHTHDTSGVQASAILKAAEVGLDIADGAMGPLSGLTSQPNLASVVHALRLTERDTGLNPDHLQSIDEYWEVVRDHYAPFESTMKASTADVYRNEMPGGQYTNLYEQAQAVGLAARWHEICRVYAEVNDLFGDIVKVTPSSKAVGDMAIFLVANNLRTADVLDTKRDLAFPESVVDLISGRMGQPPGGFPPRVVERVLRGQKPLTGRPGDSLPPADFDAVVKKLEQTLGTPPSQRDVLSYIMFPRVFNELQAHQEQYGDTSILPTPIFFYGPAVADEIAVDIEPGKTLIVKFLNVGEPQPDGSRNVSFELNGQPRDVTVRDLSIEADVEGKRKADANNPAHVGAPMPGMVVTVAVHPGDTVAKGQKLLTMEAMKMETTLYAERDGKIAEVLVSPGSRVDSGELLVVWE